MYRKKRMPWIFILAIGGLWLACGTAWANAVWWDGEVTKGPSLEKYRRLEVNHVPFMLTPEARIYERTSDYNDVVHETPISFSQIRLGQRVLILIQGHRIHQVVVLR